VDLYINIKISLHGILINYLSIGTAFPELKRTGPDSEHSPNKSGVKKTWIYTSTPSYAFMA
jgi:hypothetical protein